MVKVLYGWMHNDKTGNTNNELENGIDTALEHFKWNGHVAGVLIYEMEWNGNMK